MYSVEHFEMNEQRSKDNSKFTKTDPSDMDLMVIV